MLKSLHLIGGAPLTGKTTLTRQLAGPGVVQLSTDNIRAWMRGVVRQEEYPRLFDSHGITVEQYYEKYPTAQAALKEEIAQCKEVEQGIRALIDSRMHWASLIIEGIAVSPEFAHTMIKHHSELNIKTTFLVDTNAERIKQRIYERGLWGAAGDYTDKVKPLEVEWTILYNQWYFDQAEQYGFEITEVGK
jgi:2-phosphoglycerate kinase